MIDVCATPRRFAKLPINGDKSTPWLRWLEGWSLVAGCGVTAGLLDTSFDEQIPDLIGADLVTQSFSGVEKASRKTVEHGTHSVAVLIGQGHHQIRGIAPRTRLLVAKVVGPDGIAAPCAVVAAIDWLVASGAQIIAIPLGEPIERKEITHQIEKSAESGVVFFAAAGNGYPDPLVFPARHPLVIAVGAADFHGNLLPECSRQPRLDLVAPGSRITAPIRGRLIRRRSGSSVACVIAAGVAMLALSAGAIPTCSLNRASVLAVLGGHNSARAPPKPVIVMPGKLRVQVLKVTSRRLELEVTNVIS